MYLLIIFPNYIKGHFKISWNTRLHIKECTQEKTEEQGKKKAAHSFEVGVCLTW